eukprot:COSAG02_NODE_5155_length_4583_cov_2.407449_2_plen_1311_part_00
MIAFCFGLPLLFAGILVRKAREYQRISDSADSVEQLVADRVAQDFKVDVDTAKYIIRDIGMSASFSFITDAYRPQVLYWETLDMTRKLMLVGVVILVGRGSSAQLAIALVLSFFFFSLQLSVAPFKLTQDNLFRASTECHVFLVLVAALMMRTEPVGYEDALYDWVLSATFIVLVPGAFMVTVASKVQLALSAQSSAGVDAAFNRFRLGLAIGSDCATLFSHFEQLRSELEPPGMRLWRNKELVTHLEPDQMKAALSELSNRLPKSQALGYHFTDVDSARTILHSQGIRASTVGQLGGGVSVCLTSPVGLGWTKFGGRSFAQRVGEALWGSLWRQIMPGPAPERGFNDTALCKELVRAIYEDHNPDKLDDVAGLLSAWAGREDQLLSTLREKYHVQGRYQVEDPNKDWGKAANKLEVMLVLRIPSKKNLDKTRLVPGRPSIYIVPRDLCEPGTGSDTTNVYVPNRDIEHVFILRAPDSSTQQKQLDLMAAQTVAVRVQCKSSRDGNDGMSAVTVTELNELDSAEDKLVDQSKPVPVVAAFTATVAKPLDTAAASLRAHQHIQEANHRKQLWPENIARFSADEMAAAVHTIDQSVPQAYTLAHFFTSADEASELFKGGKGIVGIQQPDGRLGVRVSLLSPDELGWEKNAGGAFLDTAGALMFGPHWRETNVKQLQAVLILGIPTDQMPKDGAETFVIPEALMVGDNFSETVAKGTPYYSSAHIYKSYLLQRTTTADHCSAIDTEQEDLQELFARVDANGDGSVSKEEAKQYLRTERQVDLDENSINTIWTALDEDGSGDLDISEFPRFLEVVDNEIARVAADVNTPAAPMSLVQAAQKVATQFEATVVDDTEVETLRETIRRMLAALPEVYLPTEAELREELSGLRLKALKLRAKDLGIDEDEIDNTLDADDPTAAMVEIVVLATPTSTEASQSASRPDSVSSDLCELCGLLGIRVDALQAALGSNDAEAAVMELLPRATSNQATSDPILAALQAGGGSLSETIGSALEEAIEVLEQHSAGSPRKARRPLKDIIDRAEANVDAMDDAWCDAVSRSDELEHVAQLLADVQSSSADSSGPETSLAVAELLDCLDHSRGMGEKDRDPTVVALQAGGELLSSLITSVLEAAIEELEQLSAASPRKERRPIKGMIDRVETLLESVDEAWCSAVSQSNELERLASLLTRMQSSAGQSSDPGASSSLAELLDCLDLCVGSKFAGERFTTQPQPKLKLQTLDESSVPARPLSRQPPALRPPRSSTPPRKASPGQGAPNTSRSQRAKMLELRAASLEANRAARGNIGGFRRSATPPRSKP